MTEQEINELALLGPLSAPSGPARREPRAVKKAVRSAERVCVIHPASRILKT